MADLPEGPVTIMFTDLEGSTQLRTRLGDRDADALFAEHDEVVRSRIADHGGIDQAAALGDGFLAVFTSTRRAVTCAIDIQAALHDANRARAGPPLKVRIGLNTGEVAWHDGQLSGEAVHAAARVCTAATGGQILVSDVTRQLAGTMPDVSFRDVGEVDLKGFPQPWRLWDVVYVRATAAEPSQVFVGRDDELGRLRQKLHAALDGHGGMVLIGGEPGVGKTTLVRQLIAEAERCGALSVFGRCYESEGSVPYVPFVEMLEQALTLMPPDLVREDLGEDAAEVARMVPELRRRFPDIGEPLDLPPEQQRRYFFNAVSSFVARGSARFPLLLVIDDIHWADEATLLLTEHMAAQMPGLRVLGVGTYRDMELDVARPLASSVERLLRAHLVERMQVRRLDIQAVASMLEGLGGRAMPAVVVRAIYDETEGNPFFVEEVFWHLVEDGKLLDADGEVRTDIRVDELDVPESVRLVVGRRLQRLGPGAQTILAAGAVVGRAFPFRLLEQLVDVGVDQLLDVVEAAEAARIIVAEERDGDVHYSFGHELIRQTLLSGLSVLRRQRLHLAVADAIERFDPRTAQDRPSEVAAHLLQAGAAADHERVLRYLEAAADRAMEAAAFEDAVRAVDDAIAIAAGDPLRVAQLRERRGWAVRALGHFDECIRTWDEVIDVYASSGQTEEAGLLCMEAGYQLIWLTRFDEAFAMLARGMGIVGEQPGSARARLLAVIGGMTGLAGHYEQGEEHLRTAEATARQAGDDLAEGQILWGRSMSQWSNTRSAEAIQTGRRAIELLRRSNQQWILVDALAWTSYPLLVSGDPEEVAEGGALAQEAIELGRRLGHRGGEVLGVRGDVMRRARSADADGLVKLGREDLDAFASIDTPWVSLSHVLLASALIFRGDLDEALEHATLAADLETASAWSGPGWAYTLLARAWRGEVDECRGLLAAAPVPIPEPGTRPPIGTTFATMTAVQACVVAGLRAQAAERYPALASLVGVASTNGFDLASPTRVAAMAAGAAGEWDAAEELFDRARREALVFPETLEHPQIDVWHADALLQRGRPSDLERARELLATAEGTCRRLGMVPLARRAAELLAAAGGAPAAPSSLPS